MRATSTLTAFALALALVAVPHAVTRADAAGLDDHAPILIASGTDPCGATADAGVRNCGSADGTAAAPLLIADWRIAASTAAPALRLSDVTTHVVIENVDLTGSADAPALELTNVAHVTIRNAVLTGVDGPALTMRDARDVTIENSVMRVTTSANASVAPHGFAVVDVTRSEGVAFTDDAFHATDAARGLPDALLAVRDARGVTLTGNAFTTADAFGLTVDGARDVTVAGGTFTDLARAIGLVDADGTRIDGVAVTGVATGILADASGDVVISNAMITDYYPCNPTCLTTGIGFTDTSLTLTNVHVEGFDTGIAWSADPPLFLQAERVNLTANGVGLLVDGRGHSFLTGSNVDGNDVGVRNVGKSTFQARGNWWGCASGPGAADCDVTEGKVNARRVLDAPVSVTAAG